MRLAIFLITTLFSLSLDAQAKIFKKESFQFNHELNSAEYTLNLEELISYNRPHSWLNPLELPSWLNFDAEEAKISGKPIGIGLFSFYLFVLDNKGVADRAEINLKITNENYPPPPRLYWSFRHRYSYVCTNQKWESNDIRNWINYPRNNPNVSIEIEALPYWFDIKTNHNSDSYILVSKIHELPEEQQPINNMRLVMYSLYKGKKSERAVYHLMPKYCDE